MLFCHGDGFFGTIPAPVRSVPSVRRQLIRCLNCCLREWLSGCGGLASVEMPVCDRGQTLQVCVIWRWSAARAFTVMAEKHWTQSSSWCSLKVFKRYQQQDKKKKKNRAAGLEVRQEGISSCSSPIQRLKVLRIKFDRREEQRCCLPFCCGFTCCSRGLDLVRHQR